MPNSTPPRNLPPQKVMTIVVGLVAVAIGGLGLSQVLGGNPDDAASAAETTAVLTVTQDLPVGTEGAQIVAEGLVITVAVDPAAVPDDALVSVAQLAAYTLAVPVQAGDMITLSVLKANDPSHAVTIPPGMEAVSVTLPFDPAAGGYVNAGDRVTVYALLSDGGPTAPTGTEAATTGTVTVSTGPAVHTLLQEVLVLDASADIAPRYGSQAEARPTVGSITYLLALTPEDAAKMIWASVNEGVYLTLTGPESSPATVSVDRSDLVPDGFTGDLAATDDLTDALTADPADATETTPAAPSPDSTADGAVDSTPVQPTTGG